MSPARIDNRFFGIPQQVRSAGPARFKLAGESKVDVKEASDVVALPKMGDHVSHCLVPRVLVIGRPCGRCRFGSPPGSLPLEPARGDELGAVDLAVLMQKAASIPGVVASQP